MVTFCLGSARQKREYAKGLDGAVVLDNVEVLFCVSENGRNYFAYGAVPFSDFTVSEYLKYRRALCKQKVDDSAVEAFNIDPNKRLGRLVPAEMRIVQFLENTCGAVGKTVIINLDGARYGRRAAAALGRLLQACPDAYVFVTDARFVKRSKLRYKTLFFGKPVPPVPRRVYKAKLLAEKLGASKVSVM